MRYLVCRFSEYVEKDTGYIAEIAVGIALGLLALFASISLYDVLIDLPNIAERC